MTMEAMRLFVEEARKTDKYLNLALAMKETRMDWSEGFYRVKDALEVFQVESKQDQAIYDDVSDCMNEQDGRVFRDTLWSYDRLFDLVDSATMIKMQEIAES